jgi:1-pyrroline-5-carboxylate dehydrogenase
VTGSGSTAGQELVDHADIDGIVFTGSKEVGMRLIRDNATRAFPRPLIIEMGGKNPALVMSSADLDKASDGVMRSEFGAQGQKCSACSRVYVSQQIRDEFVRLPSTRRSASRSATPNQDVYLGPVISEDAVRRLNARSNGLGRRRTGLTGGRRLTGGVGARLLRGATVIDAPVNHPLFPRNYSFRHWPGSRLSKRAIDLPTEPNRPRRIFSEDDSGSSTSSAA